MQKQKQKGKVVQQTESGAQQVARWVALGALFLVPLAPLIVAGSWVWPFNFFFPFITPKAFYFRILVEIAVVAWAVLAILDRQYRPRYSLVGAVVLAFILWMFVADAFAVNAQKAFWSNFERMEGWVLLAHLGGFFVAASAVLRVEKKWRAWFLTSLGVGVFVSLYAFFQLIDPKDFPIHQGSTRIDASLGNSAYLAIYLLFNVFIALWLALTERSAWLKWSLITFAVVEGVLIFFTGTRGAVLGLVGALALAAALTALTAGRRAREWAAGALVLLIVLAGSFYFARNSAFVQETYILDRVAGISLAEGSTRFRIWDMAWEGFLVRPVTGWGQEGFNYVFNRFYNPALYGQEPWFDRAHNAFIDWLVAGGAPGFLLFLALFGSAFWLLWTRSELSRPERIALTAALAGYAVHDFFVFDNLFSYIYFFAILALIDSQVARPIKALERAPVPEAAAGITYALPIATVVAVAVIWLVNVPGLRVVTELITAISPAQEGPAANLAAFERLTTHPAFAAQEIREQLVKFATSVVGQSDVADEVKQRVVTLAVEEMKQQVASYPLDTREYLQLAYAYRAGGDAKNALAAAQRAVELTPTKQDLWITVGAFLWDLGDTSAAAEAFDKALALAPENADLASYAAAGAYAAGNPTRGDALLKAAYGTTTVDNQILAVAYYRASDWSRLIQYSTLRASAPSADVQTIFALAGVYYAAGDRASAIATIRQAVARFPEAVAAAQAAIEQIQAEQ